MNLKYLVNKGMGGGSDTFKVPSSKFQVQGLRFKVETRKQKASSECIEKVQRSRIGKFGECRAGAWRKKYLFISLFAPKKRTKEKAPRHFASACGGFPRQVHASGVAMNSHNWVLRQHNDPAPLSCTRLGCQTMGMKVKISI